MRKDILQMMKKGKKQALSVFCLCVAALLIALAGMGKLRLSKATGPKTQMPPLLSVLPEWAARMGSPVAMMEVAGDLFAHAREFRDEQALKTAVALWCSAAKRGEARAQYLIATLYDAGRVLVKDEAKAVHWYRQAAEQGLVHAQFDLAECLYFGTGTEKNEREAAEWYRRAAEQGYAMAQFDLGSCYDFGRGVQQDSCEAVKWYRVAAEQGVADAQYNLACCFEEGEGVVENAEEARKWYARAAAQGHEEARRALQELEDVKE